jgi:GWxTD domain-containing protein
MRRVSRALGLLFLILPGAAAAQPADTTFRAFYTALPTLSAAQLQKAMDGRNGLQGGFAALELHRRTNNQAHAFRAARIFGQIVKKQNNQPWAHFGLATALVRSPRAIYVVRALGVANEGIGHEVVLVEVHTHLQLALQLDPGLSEARTMLADYAEVPSALPPAQPSYTEGASYFTTLHAADSATLAKLVRDIAIIATSYEMLTVTQGEFTKQRDALKLFWKKRSVRDGVSPEARVLEHYRRIQYARTHFGPPVPYYTVYGRKRVGLEAEMDDRGLVYVRFGAPHNLDYVTDEVTTDQKRRHGPEVWAYLQPDGRWHTYIFDNRGSMIADPLRGLNRNNTVAENLANQRVMDILRKYDARYHFIAMRAENVRLHNFMGKTMPGYAGKARTRQSEAMEDARRQNERIVERNRRMLFAAFDMDAARPRFPRPLTLFHDFATFRGRGCTDVVYSVAAPVRSYTLTMAVADTFTWDAQSIDTLVTGSVQPGEFLRASGVFCSTPDHNSYVRLTVTADSSMGTTAGGELRIPDYTRSQLMISDMLIAAAEVGPFVRGNARLSLVPPRQFKEGEPFRVFYELYNLPAGRSYRTEITLTSTEGNAFSRLFKGKTRTSVTFEGNAEGRDVVQELRTLIPQIESGEAEVLIKVTDLVTGETAQNKKKIWILPAD